MTATRQTVIVQGLDREELASAARALQGHDGEPLRLVLHDGALLPLPHAVTEALYQIVAFLADGDVAIGQFDGYTPDEAARLLAAEPVRELQMQQLARAQQVRHVRGPLAAGFGGVNDAQGRGQPCRSAETRDDIEGESRLRRPTEAGCRIQQSFWWMRGSP